MTFYLHVCFLFVSPNPLDYHKRPYSRLKQMGLRFPSPFSHLTDVSDLVDLYTTNSYTVKPVYQSSCSNNNDTCIQEFFETNKKRIFYPCVDQRLFAHCQQHWIMVYDTIIQKWRSYYKEPCLAYWTVLCRYYGPS